jgi:hypothetical protein
MIIRKSAIISLYIINRLVSIIGRQTVSREVRTEFVNIVAYRLKAGLYESKRTSIATQRINKNAYFSGNVVKTSSVSAEINTLTIAASESMKLKDSTMRLLDLPADGYNRQIQTEAD